MKIKKIIFFIFAGIWIFVPLLLIALINRLVYTTTGDYCPDLGSAYMFLQVLWTIFSLFILVLIIDRDKVDIKKAMADAEKRDIKPCGFRVVEVKS